MDADPCRLRVPGVRTTKFGPVGRRLPLRLWAERSDLDPDPGWDPENDDPALWHGTWHPDYRSTWVYLPAGLVVTGDEERTYSYGSRVHRPGRQSVAAMA